MYVIVTLHVKYVCDNYAGDKGNDGESQIREKQKGT